ncbi:amino acid ABC transporter substrate-binding protein [Clostridiaceae bacterium OM08-6BH]|nr:amino acid ABC transporter substrate-binding protein [Clostridiaceae bacterium OM08-6BH]
MKKKMVSVMLAAAMAATLLAGCGSSSAAEGTTDAATEETADTAETSADEAAEVTTVEPGVLTMGTNATFPPYEYKDGDAVVGIDPDIAQALADKLGLKLEVIDMEFDSLVASVQSGKVDIVLAGMTVNEERKKNVDFTDSYANGVQVIIVADGSDIATFDDLAGKLIGVQQGTTGHVYCSDDWGEENVVAFQSGAAAVQALQQGKVDCVVIDQEPAKAFVEANEGLKILDTQYANEEYAAAVSKKNPKLTEALNKALQELKDDGTVQEILDKYIKAE